MSVVPFAVAGWLVVWGLVGMIRSTRLIHLTVCLGVLQAGTYVLLISIGDAAGAHVPLYAEVSPDTAAVDPIVQAMTLTDIVVGATVTAVLLALAIQADKHRRTTDPDELSPMKG